MDGHPKTLQPDMPCRVAFILFLDHGIEAIPVINETCEVIGIISEGDLMVENNLWKQVGEVLTREVVSVRETAALDRALRLFQSRRLRCIPVVNRHDTLVGILRRRDVLSYYLEKRRAPDALCNDADDPSGGESTPGS
jgi:CBS-domain-containing membrane protein